MASSTIAPLVTIRDLEVTIEQLFDRIRESNQSLTPDQAIDIISQLRTYLAPPQYRTVVQFEEDGRKKRSSASAQNWNFGSGEIVLYFDSVSSASATFDAPSTTPTAAPVMRMPAPADTVSPSTSSNAKLEIQQCCEALAEAEKAGKQFISIKWFREMYLGALSYPWARNVDDRQRVLTAAIDAGAVLVKKIPNPRSPMYPTTTISLNKASNVVAIPSRFSPVPIHGESASSTLLKDRGQR